MTLKFQKFCNFRRILYPVNTYNDAVFSEESTNAFFTRQVEFQMFSRSCPYDDN